MTHRRFKAELSNDLPNEKRRRWIHWVRFVDGQWKLDQYSVEFRVSHSDRIIKPGWMNDPVKVRVVLLFYYPHFWKSRKTLENAQSMLLDIEAWKGDGKRLSKNLRRAATYGDALLYFSRCLEPSRNLRLHFSEKPPVPLSAAERRNAFSDITRDLFVTRESQEESIDLLMDRRSSRSTINVLAKVVESSTFSTLLSYCGNTLRAIRLGLIPNIEKSDLQRWSRLDRLKHRGQFIKYPSALQKLRDELFSIEYALALYEDELVDPDLPVG